MVGNNYVGVDVVLKTEDWQPSQKIDGLDLKSKSYQIAVTSSMMQCLSSVTELWLY